jgi:hypothetical protein
MQPAIYLCQIRDKHTRQPQSVVFEIEAWSEYGCLAKMESLTGIKINGVTNYLDWVAIG